MSYSNEPSGSVAVDHTPSLVFNNLTTNGERVAYVHKTDVYALREAATDGKTDAAVEKVPYDEAHPVMGVKWVEVGGNHYLFICTTRGFHVLDSSAARTVFFFLLDSVLTASDDTLMFCRGVAAIPGTSQVCVGASNGAVFVFSCADKESFSKTHTLSEHSEPLCALHASAEHLVSGDDGGTVVVWDASSRSKKCSFDGAGFPCTSVVTRSDVAVAGYASGHIRVYQISSARMHCEIAAHARCVTAMDIHPSRGSFCTVGEDAVLNVWKAPDFESKEDEEVGLEICTPVPDRLLTGVQFARGGEDAIIASSFDTHSIQYWTRG